MSSAATSEAGRQLASQRWGARKPVRLAHELSARASELPDDERQRLVAAIFSTLWATGGWSALRRRSIQQELNLVKDLPRSSATRAQVTMHVEERILYQLREEPVQNMLRPLFIFVLGFAISGLIATVSEDVPIFVIFLVEGLLIAVVAWALAVFVRSRLIQRSRRRHDHLLKAARKVADTPAAPGGRNVESG
jgi:hypothetical protein